MKAQIRRCVDIQIQPKTIAHPHILLMKGRRIGWLTCWSKESVKAESHITAPSNRTDLSHCFLNLLKPIICSLRCLWLIRLLKFLVSYSIGCRDSCRGNCCRCTWRFERRVVFLACEKIYGPFLLLNDLLH